MHTSFAVYFPDSALSAFLGTCVQNLSQAYYLLISKYACQSHVWPIKLYKPIWRPCVAKGNRLLSWIFVLLLQLQAEAF